MYGRGTKLSNGEIAPAAGGVVCRMVAACLALCVAGCIPSLSGPDRLYPISAEIGAITDQASLLPDFRAYSVMPETQRVFYRNAIIDARMYAIDLQYSEYEAALTHERQEADFATAAANIGLTSTSTLIASVQAKNILTSVAGGLTGVNAAYGDKVLLNRTIQVLENQMRGARAKIATKIIAGSKLSSRDYGLGMALSDLEEYYRAGTITGALIDVTDTVSKETTLQKDRKDSYVISYGFASDDAAKKLRAYWKPNGKLNAAHRDNLIALLVGKLHVTDPLSAVLDLPEFASVRVQLLQLAIEKGFIQ
jgi:hypothetical protein